MARVEIAYGHACELTAQQLVGLADFALGRLGAAASDTLSMATVTLAEMTELHIEYMGETGPTDVLAFPMDEDDGAHNGAGRVLGDVIVCPEYAASSAHARSVAVSDEIAILTVHGILHLFGYDHADPDSERVMFGLQREIVDAWFARDDVDGAL